MSWLVIAAIPDSSPLFLTTDTLAASRQPVALHIHSPWTHMGGEHNLGAGLSEFLQLANKDIQLHGALERHFHQHGVLTCNAVAFQHIGHFRRVSVELWLVLRNHIQINKRDDVIPQLHGVHHGVIAGNDPVLFQLLDPGGHCRRGQVGLLRDGFQ